MIGIPNKVLCPYCLQELTKKNIHITCPTCGQLVSSNSKQPRCKSPGCHNNVANDKTCCYSDCRAKLPPDILDYDKYLSFSIIGTTGSGKTNFLTTMLYELRHSNYSDFVLSPMDENTATTFEMHMNEVYEHKQPVSATAPGQPPQPLQWRIGHRAKKKPNKIPSYALTIFDGAGEDFKRMDPTISRYISGSKVLVVLIDPLSLKGVREQINPNVLNWSSPVEQGKDASVALVDELANYIRRSCGIQAGHFINKDVAVVFTKIDAVEEYFSSATVMQESPHRKQGGFVEVDGNAVDAEIRSWLNKMGEQAFLSAIDGNFKENRIKFFGISSFGQPPTGENQLGQIIPHRVLDPLMWMLAKEKIIPTV